MSRCEGCKKYADCKDGSGLTWPCGAYRSTVTTNADRIRGMSDEELADFLFSMQKSIWNALCTELGWSESKMTDASENGTAFIDWLRQPAETEEKE